MKNLSFILFLFFVSFNATSQELVNIKEPVFKVGEKLSYKFRYGFITAAVATLKVSDSNIKFDNKPTFHLTAEGRTSGTFNVFYRVRNRYDSYIDQSDLVPYLYTENIREGSYRRNDKARFYQNEKKVVADKGTFKGGKQTFDIRTEFVVVLTNRTKQEVSEDNSIKAMLERFPLDLRQRSQ